MAIRTGRLGNITYAKETTWGTQASATQYFRASTENMKRMIENAEDPSLVSEIYTTNMIKIADGISGSIEGVVHGGEMGSFIYGVLGTHASIVNPVKAYMMIGYNSTDNYIRLTKTGTSLLAETSTNGSSWTPDTNFSSAAGVIDVSAAAYDTLAELSAHIAGRTGYDAVVFGDDTDSSDLDDFTATTVRSNDTKVGALLMTITKTSTAAKKHTITPALATTSLPSWTFTFNRVLGTNKSVAATGCKVGTLTLANTAKDICKFTMNIDGKAEVNDVTDSVLTPGTEDPFITANMKIVCENSSGALIEFDEVKDFSITLNANLDDNKVVGSYYKKEQDRQKATMEISFTANNTSGQYAVRDEWINDNAVSMYIYWKGNDYADTTNLIPYSMFFRFPEVKLTDFSSPLSTPDRLTITGAGTVVKPTNATYTKHAYAYIVDDNTSSY